MNFKSTIIGIAASAILLAVLGLARLYVVKSNSPDLELREIETIAFEPPPPPPEDEPPQETPPPPPTLTKVSLLQDPTRVPIPQARVPMDIKAPVESFFTDLAPAPIPAAPRPVSRTTPRPATSRAKLERSVYRLHELDSRPRILSHPQATFPESLSKRGVKSVTVIFEIELSPTGSVRIIRLVATAYDELIPEATKVAAGSRFTPPLHNGKPVRSIMHFPVIIEKK